MTPEQHKEELSKAYVHAVAAQCAFKVGNWSQDSSCVDLSVGASGVLGNGTLADPQIDLQLKCTNDPSVMHADYISWTLERSHYDALRSRAANPRLLVVLTIPEEVLRTVEHTIEHLLIRRCAFWVKMTGMPATERDSKTVRLPRSQIFSPEQLKAIMDKLSREEEF